MEQTFPLTITTIGGKIYAHSVISVLLPGAEGLFEVFPNHEATVADLQEGQIEIRSTDKPAIYHIDKGIVMISEENAQFQVWITAENPSLVTKEGITTQRERER